MSFEEYVQSKINPLIKSLTTIKLEYRKIYLGSQEHEVSIEIDGVVRVTKRKINGLTVIPEYKFSDYIYWNDNKCAIVIGLNPSVADEMDLDQTNINMTSFLNRKKYGSYYLFNVYPLVSSSPKEAEEDHLSSSFISTLSEIVDYNNHLQPIDQLDVFLMWGKLKVKYDKTLETHLNILANNNKLFCTCVSDGSALIFAHANIRGKLPSSLKKVKVKSVSKRKRAEYIDVNLITTPIDED